MCNSARKWFHAYIYRQIKALLGIRGKPNASTLIKVSTGMNYDNMYSDILDYQNYKKVLYADEYDKADIAKRLGVPTTMNFRLAQHLDKVNFSTKLKLVLTLNLQKIIAWRIGCRF